MELSEPATLRQQMQRERPAGFAEVTLLDIIIIENYEKKIQRLPLLRRLANCEVASKAARLVE